MFNPLVYDFLRLFLHLRHNYTVRRHLCGGRPHELGDRKSACPVPLEHARMTAFHFCDKCVCKRGSPALRQHRRRNGRALDREGRGDIEAVKGDFVPGKRYHSHNPAVHFLRCLLYTSRKSRAPPKFPSVKMLWIALPIFEIADTILSNTSTPASPNTFRITSRTLSRLSRRICTAEIIRVITPTTGSTFPRMPLNGPKIAPPSF